MVAIKLPQLNDLRIASPCTVDWGSMTGTDQVRHCGECQLNVYNISEMTTQEAQELIARTEGRLCIRMYKRSDGTVITRDCPVGLAAARAHIARVACRVGAVAASILAAVVLGKSRSPFEERSGLTASDPFYSIASVFGRVAPSKQVFMGIRCTLPPPPPAQTNTAANFWEIFK